MDAVCLKGDWDVILHHGEEGQIEGLLVFHTRTYYGFRLILMPPMTAYNGIHIFYPDDMKGHSLTSFHNMVSEALISKLPKHHLYYQQYHPDYNNWLALYWLGYKETTRYTYLMPEGTGKEENTKQLRDNLRRSIKNAAKYCSIVDIDLDTFLKESERAYTERNKALPMNKAVLQGLADKFGGTKQLSIKACKHNETGELLSGTIMAHDKQRTYYISSFYHAKVKPTGTVSYLIWEGIHDGRGKTFDFEGSILKEVEFYFRSFGAELTPHYRIYKVPSFLLRMGLSLFKPNFFA